VPEFSREPSRGPEAQEPRSGQAAGGGGLTAASRHPISKSKSQNMPGELSFETV
jgi:hypothetical protein